MRIIGPNTFSMDKILDFIHEDDDADLQSKRMRFERTFKRLIILKKFSKKIGLEFDVEHFEMSKFIRMDDNDSNDGEDFNEIDHHQVQNKLEQVNIQQIKK